MNSVPRTILCRILAAAIFVGLTLAHSHTLDAQTRIAPEKFIPSFSQSQNPDCPYDQNKILANVVKYDLLAPTYVVFDQCFALSGRGNSWQTIHSYNPDALIFVYMNGPALYTINQGWTLRPSGSDIAWVQANHGTNSSDRWTGKGRKFNDYLIGSHAFDSYDQTLQMNLLNTKWLQYWVDSFATWHGRANPYGGAISTAGVDGIFADNSAYAIAPLYRIGHTDEAASLDTPFDYAGAWTTQNAAFYQGLLSFTNYASSQLDALYGLKLLPNSFSLLRPAEWAGADAVTNPAFAGMAECAMSCSWGHPLIHDANGSTDLSTTITTMRDTKRTKVLFDNTVRSCALDMSGSYGAYSSLSCWELFWYEMGTFLQGLDTEVGNAYFGFSVDNNIRWWDELDPAFLHLGHQVGNFTNNNGLMTREFEDGWVVVNGTLSTKSGIAVPNGTARVLSHANFKTPNNAALVSSYSLGPTRSVILLKSGRNITNADNPLAGSGPPAISTTSMPRGISGGAYSSTILASGGTAPYGWSMVSGSLPGGLTRSGAVISGTPTTPGTFNFTVRVTDGTSPTPRTDDQALSIMVYARSQISADPFTATTTACLDAYNARWVLTSDGGTVNCVKVDAAADVIYGSTDSYAGWVARNAETFANDQYASLKIAAMPADTSEGLQFVGVGARIGTAIGGSRSLYEVVLYKVGTTQHTSIVKIVNGVASTVADTTSVTWSVGNRLEIEVFGSTISALKDGVVVQSYLDPNPIAGGAPGMVMAGGTGSRAAGDDFIGGNLITTGSGPNQAPTVNAGSAQTVTLPAAATLTAAANDDGLPNGALTYQWSVVSGTGVTFSSPTSASTQASFSTSGPRTLRVTVSDGPLSALSDVAISVTAMVAQNKAPLSNAGPDQTISLPSTATLTASATDDGLPTGSTLTYQWSVATGNGATFASPNSPATQVSLAAAGTFLFTVTVSDGLLSSTDDVEIVATEPVYTRSMVSSDAFAATTTACLDTYSTSWVLTSDGGTVNCIQIDATSDVIYGSTNSYEGWVAGHAATFANDQFASLKIAAMPADGSEGLQFVGVGARIGAGIGANRSLYEVVLYKAGITQHTSLVKVVNGVASTLVSTTGVTWADGNRIEIEVLGSTVRALKDGVVVQSYVDPSPIAGGKPGIVMAGGAANRAAGDDFIGGNLLMGAITNTAPTVTAGSPQTVALPATAALTATGSDDALPNSALTYQWSVVTGTGVTFTTPNSPTSQAAFSSAGVRTLRITANDGLLLATSDVTITVNAAPNLPPVSSAGPDQTIALPATATLAASATDDGMPTGSSLTYLWSVVTGTGVTFTSSSSSSTRASFASAGVRMLRVTVSDGILSSSDDVMVTVNAGGNTVPVSNAGPDQTIEVSAPSTLTATATDDGMPTGSTLTYLWSVVSGAGVTFTSPAAAATRVSFSAAGSFMLRVTVSDGLLSSSDDVSVVVTDPVYARSMVSSDAFTATTTACLNTYSTRWSLTSDGGSVNCVKVDAAADVIYGTTNSYEGWVARNTATFANDQYASLKITALPADTSEGLQFVGVGVRIGTAIGATRSLYEVVIYKAGVIQHTSLVKVVNGVASTLASTTTAAWAVGNRIEIEAFGSLIRALKDGVVVHSYVDPNPIAGGTPGMVMAGGSATTAAGDDFTGGNLLTGSTQPTEGRSQVSSDAFTATTTACLNSYSASWLLINDGGTVNCVKVDAATDVIYGSTNSYAGWVAQNTATFNNDQYASLKITAMPADGSEGLQFVGVGARIGTAIGGNRTMYEVVLYKAGTTQHTSLVKVLNGVASTLASTATTTWSAGNRIEIEVLGSTVTALKDGVVIQSYVDPRPIVGGKPGIVMAGGTGARAAGDDFIGGNLLTAAVISQAPLVAPEAVVNTSGGGNPAGGGNAPPIVNAPGDDRAAPVLTLVVTKNGETRMGQITPMAIQSNDDRIQSVELRIDGQVVATAVGGSLVYRWPAQTVVGSHSVQAIAYGGGGMVASNSVALEVK